MDRATSVNTVYFRSSSLTVLFRNCMFDNFLFAAAPLTAVNYSEQINLHIRTLERITARTREASGVQLLLFKVCR